MSTAIWKRVSDTQPGAQVFHAWQMELPLALEAGGKDASWRFITWDAAKNGVATGPQGRWTVIE